MKQKPILVYLSRHEIHPGILADLAAYDIRHIDRRFYSPAHAIEIIGLLCGDKPPAVLIVTMPRGWVAPFIQGVRARWQGAGSPAIVRAVMFGEKWNGCYALRTLAKNGEVHEREWIPQGSEADRRLQALHRANREAQTALLNRLEEL